MCTLYCVVHISQQLYIWGYMHTSTHRFQNQFEIHRFCPKRSARTAYTIGALYGSEMLLTLSLSVDHKIDYGIKM